MSCVWRDSAPTGGLARSGDVGGYLPYNVNCRRRVCFGVHRRQTRPARSHNDGAFQSRYSSGDSYIEGTMDVNCL